MCCSSRESKIGDRDDVLATRAIALLLLEGGRGGGRRRTRPAATALPGTRAAAATDVAGRRPLRRAATRPTANEILLLPAARCMADGRPLGRGDRTGPAQPRVRRPLSYRALLNRAVILSALGDHTEADRGFGSRPGHGGPLTEAHLIRARVLHRAGDFKRASHEIDAGLKLKSDQPGLLELRGVMLTEAGHAKDGLVFLDQAISLSPNHFAYLHKAAALVALKRYEEAVYQCTMALKRDPELPQAYLSRARLLRRALDLGSSPGRSGTGGGLGSRGSSPSDGDHADLREVLARASRAHRPMAFASRADISPGVGRVDPDLGFDRGLSVMTAISLADLIRHKAEQIETVKTPVFASVHLNGEARAQS